MTTTLSKQHQDKIIKELTDLPTYEIKWVNSYQPNEIDFIFELMQTQTGKHGWLLECNTLKTKLRKIGYG